MARTEFQQHQRLSRSLTFQFAEEVFKVFSQDKFRRPGEAFQPVFFALFPRGKSARVTGELTREAPNLWVDEFGQRWVRTETFPWKWWLFGTGIFWDEPGWGSLGSWGAT